VESAAVMERAPQDNDGLMEMGVWSRE